MMCGIRAAWDQVDRRMRDVGVVGDTKWVDRQMEYKGWHRREFVDSLVEHRRWV